MSIHKGASSGALPRFSRSTAAPPNAPTFRKRVSAVVCDVWAIAFAFAAVVFSSACLYDLGSRHGWGIQTTFNHGRPVPTTFWDCVYFSVVTISTLGYGDYRPISYGRIVVALEVISGIVLAGVLVARLVSGRMDRISGRLLRGQMNGEIQSFRRQLTPLITAIRATHVSTTGAPPGWQLHRAVGLGKAIARYWRYEARQPDLTEVMPVRACSRLLGELISLLECVDTQVRQQGQAVSQQERQEIRALADSVLAVATVLRERSPDQGIPHLCEKTSEAVAKLRGL